MLALILFHILKQIEGILSFQLRPHLLKSNIMLAENKNFQKILTQKKITFFFKKFQNLEKDLDLFSK